MLPEVGGRVTAKSRGCEVLHLKNHAIMLRVYAGAIGHCRGLQLAGQAELARSVLASAGIEAFLVNEHVVNVNWLYANAVGGVSAGPGV